METSVVCMLQALASSFVYRGTLTNQIITVHKILCLAGVGLLLVYQGRTEVGKAS